MDDIAVDGIVDERIGFNASLAAARYRQLTAD